MGFNRQMPREIAHERRRMGGIARRRESGAAARREIA
jgi:hypothetical protein